MPICLMSRCKKKVKGRRRRKGLIQVGDVFDELYCVKHAKFMRERAKFIDDMKCPTCGRMYP